MRSYEQEIERLRILHYALELPVCLTIRGETVFSMPETIRTASLVSGSPELSQCRLDEVSTVQYIRTEGAESFIFLVLDEDAVLSIGPFLIEPLPDSFLTELARAKKIKLREKDAMQHYYASLRLLSGQRFFYAGRLAEQLFPLRQGQSAPDAASAPKAEFIQPEFYRQTRDYRTQQFWHSPYLVEQEICRAISTGDSVDAHRILKEINSRPRARLAGTALRSLKNSVICSCSFMARAAISGGVSPDEAFTLSDAYIQRIEQCLDVRELLQFEDEMVDGYTDCVSRAKSSRYSSAVNQAIRYIDAHLCEPISVASIAQEVYLSPNYLSSVFVRETGQTLHSYIVRRRIEESSFFVRSSSDPIADIASFYQFSSQSHYVRSFKEIMGTTPGAYRKRAELAEAQRDPPD